MTLQEVTTELEDITQRINTILPLYEVSETRYNTRFYQLYLNSPRGNDKGREAEAKAILIEEGLYEAYMSLKVDLKVLYNKKDCLIEVSKNLRSIAVSSV